MARDAPSRPQSPTKASGPTGLKPNVLGVPGVTFMVVSAAAPLTVMAGVAPLALSIGGIGVPLGYLAAGVILCIFSVGFTAMAKEIPQTGGFFVYIGHAFGGVAGFAAAVVAIVAYNALQIGVYGLFAVQAQDAMQVLLGVSLPWPLIAVVAVGLVWLLGYFGLDVGIKVLGVLILLESGILALMGLSIVARGGASGMEFSSFSPSHLTDPGVLAVVGICFAAFMGFESTVLYRAEARDPERTIPRATFLAVGFMGLFYAFIVWSVVQALGEANTVAEAGKQGPALFFNVIGSYVGGWAKDLTYVLIVTSVYASQLAFHNAINRYVYALARVGALPSVLGRLHPRSGSPYVAGLVQSVVALFVIGLFAFSGLDPFRDLLISVNTPGIVGIVSLQVLASLAAVAYFLRQPPTRKSRALAASAMLSSVLMLGVIYLLVKNIAVLTGAGHTVNVVLLLIMPIVLAAGVAGGLWLRRVRPEVIDSMGRDGGVDSAEVLVS